MIFVQPVDRRRALVIKAARAEMQSEAPDSPPQEDKEKLMAALILAADLARSPPKTTPPACPTPTPPRGATPDPDVPPCSSKCLGPIRIDSVPPVVFIKPLANEVTLANEVVETDDKKKNKKIMMIKKKRAAPSLSSSGIAGGSRKRRRLLGMPPPPDQQLQLRQGGRRTAALPLLPAALPPLPSWSRPIGPPPRLPSLKLWEAMPSGKVAAAPKDQALQQRRRGTGQAPRRRKVAAATTAPPPGGESRRRPRPAASIAKAAVVEP